MPQQPLPLAPSDRVSPLIAKIRRLAHARRSLLLAEVVLALVLGLLGAIHLALPTLLDVLLRGHLSANALLVGLAVLLYASETAGAIVERAMGRTLGVQRTRVRQIAWLLLLVPGVMLLRRVVQALGMGLGAVVLFASLLLYVVLVVLLARPLRLSAFFTIWMGRGVDLVDRLLSGLAHAWLRLGRALLPSPVLHPDRNADLLVTLLRKRTAAPGADATGADATGPAR